MRDSSIDRLSGLLIIYMIYRHCLMAGGLLPPLIEDTVFNYPLMFFMAWFFFKAGMYHTDKELHEVLKKAIGRLLVPYIVFSITAVLIIGLIHWGLEGFDSFISVFKEVPIYLKREGAVICNAPLWFLLSLFFVRLFFSLLKKLRIPLLVTVFSSFLAGWLIFAYSVPIGLYFGDIAFGLVFYCLGVLLKEKQYNKTVYLTSLLVYLGLLTYLFFSSFQSGHDTVIQQPYPLVRFFNLAGCILFNNIFKRVPKLQFPFLAKIGKDSMTLLVTHFIIITVLIYSNRISWHLPNPFLFLIVLVSLSILLPVFVIIFNHPRLQWMVGRNTLTISIKNEILTTVLIMGIMITMTLYVLYKGISLYAGCP